MAAIEREFLNLEASQGGWHVLFQRLQQISRLNAGTQLVAKTPLNINRNRYRDVLPIDETRVKLQDQNNDYINANFVKVEAVNRTYILTQGPLQHTLGHFWQMVWEQKTAGIVMLNKCMERGMNKCAKYWPDLGENPMMFNDLYVVESMRSEEAESYCLTYLTLHNLEVRMCFSCRWVARLVSYCGQLICRFT
jgi:tyrosine-protein phosphatase non-receptor type 1